VRGTQTPAEHASPLPHAVSTTQSVQPEASVAQCTGKPSPAHCLVPSAHWSTQLAWHTPPEHDLPIPHEVAAPNALQPVAASS
jgi:hypothetical protein